MFFFKNGCFTKKIKNYLKKLKLNMNELVERLVEEAGITPEQAIKAIAALSGYVKEKFPMLGGAVDNLFGENTA